MITKIWGPGCWTFEHCVTFGYPSDPTEEDKKNFKNHFENLGNVLPCKYCRESYKQFINESDTKLTMDVLKDRDTLTKWLYDIHNKVNKKLGVDYGVTYNDIVRRYEAYRATCNAVNTKAKGCIKPLRGDSYKVADYKECHILPLKTVRRFLNYSRKRGLSTYDYIFLAKYEKDDRLKTQICDINCPDWVKRNKECQEIIKFMRINNIPSLEIDGEYKGFPTIPELMLIMRLCSNMNNEELLEIKLKL